MKRGLGLAAALMVVLAGCTSPAEPPVPAKPVASAPATAPAPPPPPDTCGAAPLQSLIGRPRTEIPVPVRPELQRVMCTTCPATTDYIENRLNFLFDAATGLIREIRCG